MNEIEYAIQQLERRADAVSSIGEFEEYNALTTALTVLRAELTRQDAKPLTCNGCKWHPIKYDFLGCIISRCENCCRQTILTDRYEPKGENA